MKHLGKALFGTAITVILLWWALRGVPFAEVWRHMRGGDPLLLAAAVAVATFGFLIRALRWKVLLAPVRSDTSLRSRFAAVSIGFMANNVLPARVGEFARAYALSRLEPVSASAAFGSLVIERLLDGIVLLLLLMLPPLSPGFPATGALSEGRGAVRLRGGRVAVAVVLAGLVVVAAWPSAFMRVARRAAARLPASAARPAVDALEALLDSVAVLRSPRLLTLGLLWTAGFWLFHGISFWLGMLAFDIHTGLVSAWFTEAVVGFGVALPSAPGFIGTFHASANFALSNVYGVEEARSLAFAFGYHFGGWIPITVIGVAYAWRLGLSLGDVGAAEERVEDIIEVEHPGSARARGRTRA
ncbi:MAG: flippase-like domain-containing protein [Gemmatimonadetes bacterium]|nr:flippase-like domain-containing protein [Gemmatimonadota bacterium]